MSILFLLAVESTFNPGYIGGTTVIVTVGAVITELEVHNSDSMFGGSIVLLAASPIPTLFCANTSTVTTEMLQR